MTFPLAHADASFGPLQLVGVAALAVPYVLRVRTLAAEGRGPSVARQWSFAAGVALLAIALGSPAAHFGEDLLVAHMAQHLLIADIAALLIVLGLTGPVLQPLLAIRGLGWLRALGHPGVAFGLWVANLVIWHVPAIHEAALDTEALHALQHAAFLGAGIGIWLALLGPLPKPAWFGRGAQFGYVIGVRFAGAALGNVLAWAGSPLFDAYRNGEAYWELSPLSDQGAAGTLMMIEGGFVTLGLLAWLFFRAAREGEERQALIELAAEQGVELDPRRAQRAVSAGEGGRLAERLRREGARAGRS